MGEIRIVRSLPDTVWDQFIGQNPFSSIFHAPEMFQVFARAEGYQPSLWAAVNQRGRPLCLLLPVQVNIFNGLFRQFTTRAIAYGSILWEPNKDGEEALAHLLKSYVRKVDGTPLFTELRNLVDLEDIQPILRKQGFAYEDHLNYLIDINLPSEAIFQNIGKRTRKNIRRALNKGEVLIEEVKERERIAICYELIRRTYHAVRVPLGSRSLFEAAFDVLYPKGMIRFVLAYVKGVPVATSVELLYKDVIYGWYSGLDRNYSKYVPNELLMWDILQWGSRNGYRVYDFGGAGKPEEEYGVRDFKAKFGGELVCFGRNTNVHAPFRLRLSTLGYTVLRRFFS